MVEPSRHSTFEANKVSEVGYELVAFVALDFARLYRLPVENLELTVSD